MRRQPPGVTNSPEDLCIRFVNTVAWRLRRPREERLAAPGALILWFGEKGFGSQRYLGHLAASWQEEPQLAAELYAKAIQLREAIYDALRARIEGRPPKADDLTVLNECLARSAGGIEIALTDNDMGWRLASLDADPLDLLRPIAVSAADLMTGPRAHKVRQCSDDRGCGWLFVDESRARNRRWCSMGDCGNRAKASRHRARKRIHTEEPA
ncbi:MAG: ABATE domain-containing protein [Verrucomicrobia bacterium]|nr:ABATE domain-containing protein [Verrucomicrobiota bacterium]